MSRVDPQGIINGWVAYGVRVAHHDDILHQHRANGCQVCATITHGTIQARTGPNDLWVEVLWDDSAVPLHMRRYELNRVSQ